VAVHAFEVLAEPVRRRILELLASGESASGSIVTVIQREFGISQPAVSQHLKVLRENGFASVRAEGNRRLYSVVHAPLREVDAWLNRFRPAWISPLDALEALATEVARGKRDRRAPERPSAADPPSAARPRFTDEERNIS
jgi:DNA-binding transcriptional ArsR family regulator